MAQETTPTSGTPATKSASDIYVAQEGGDHYQAEYQHWDWVVDAEIGYLCGNATKYLSRWRKKNGLEDLKKSLTYLDKMIATRKNADWHYRESRWKTNAMTERFIEVNGIGKEEAEIIHLLAGPCQPEMLRLARERLDALVRTAQKAAEGQAGPAPTLPPASTLAATPAAPCGGAGRATGQGAGGKATTASQPAGLTGMEHPFGYDEEQEQ